MTDGIEGGGYTAGVHEYGRYTAVAIVQYWKGDDLSGGIDDGCYETTTLKACLRANSVYACMPAGSRVFIGSSTPPPPPHTVYTFSGLWPEPFWGSSVSALPVAFDCILFACLGFDT